MIRVDPGEPRDPPDPAPRPDPGPALTITYDPRVVTRDRYPEFRDLLDRLAEGGATVRVCDAAGAPRGPGLPAVTLLLQLLACDFVAGACLVAVLATWDALPFAAIARVVPAAFAVVAGCRVASAARAAWAGRPGD